jgi:hypothetical protein
LAIIQISRIQNRRGLQENLPLPLAAAELGWALDSQRLYIGNGSTTEGAPRIGNTEILTEHSNITDLPDAYTFSGYEAGGYEVNTGPSTLDYKTRSIQNKFDDIVSIRDFADQINYAGAGGLGDGKLHGADGLENDAAVFNRAITELHNAITLKDNPRLRRTIHIPAGIYVLDAIINLLPFVKLKGDGKDATFIVQTGSCGVIQSVGSGDIRPGNIEVEGMTLINIHEFDVAQLDSTANVFFNRVRMQRGNWTPGTSIATLISSKPTTLPVQAKSCVTISSSVTIPFPLFSNTIMFSNCDFVGAAYGINVIGNVYNVNVVNGNFTYLYMGLSIGDGSNPYPHEIKVSHSYFDEIYGEGIYAPYVGSVQTNIVSAFNTFKDVGNESFPYDPNTANVLIQPVVHLGGKNSYSIADTFQERNIGSTPVINLDGEASYAILPEGMLQLGKQVLIGGKDLNLVDDTSGTVGIIGYHVPGATIRPTMLEYSILRSTIQRTGVMKIVSIGSDVTFEDEYVETDNVGVTLTPVVSGDSIVLNYVISSYSNTDATLKTTTRTLI